MRSNVFAALGAALVVAGCASRPATPSVQVLEITAGDFYFQAPDTVRAGRTEFRMTNAGGHHVMVIARLDSGKTMADVAAVPDTADSPGWMVDMGGPVTGDSNGVIVASMDLTPGRWLLYCYFGDDNGVPHFAKGMVHELIVTGPAVTASAPEADIVVTVTDFAFTPSRPITSGRHTIRFVNTSGQGHEIIMARLNDGAHQAEWIAARIGHTPSPSRSFGGIGGLTAGHTMDMTADFAPGNYIWYCFFRDEAQHKSHAELGMIKEIRVD